MEIDKKSWKLKKIEAWKQKKLFEDKNIFNLKNII